MQLDAGKYASDWKLTLHQLGASEKYNLSVVLRIIAVELAYGGQRTLLVMIIYIDIDDSFKILNKNNQSVGIEDS